MPDSQPTVADVLDFWFVQSQPKQWFVRDAAFDTAIADRFGELHACADAGEMDGWADTADGALALVLVLDQFSRNLFRNDAKAFATDVKALGIARAAIDAGFDQQVEERRRTFFYVPFEHSEKLADQERCIELSATLTNKDFLGWAEKHKVIIERFGRFPHRNAVLGRISTPEEAEFLKQEGSSF